MLLALLLLPLGVLLVFLITRASARLAPSHEASGIELPALLKEVRRIELLAKGLVKESVGGEYHSSFKGQGIDFDEFREYQPGDEVRAIDWNVTARMRQPYIKKFVEDRELTVVLMVDVSASGDYGSSETSKRHLAAKVAAAFAFAAIQNNDKVALILFSDDVELFVPPNKGSSHILRIVREILAWQPNGRATNAEPALQLLIKAIRHRALTFLISDFQAPHIATQLKVPSIKHDLVAVQVTDPHEAELPNAGRVTLSDPETGDLVTINSSDPNLRIQYHEADRKWRASLAAELKRLSIDHIELETGRDYRPALHTFFKRRTRRNN